LKKFYLSSGVYTGNIPKLGEDETVALRNMYKNLVTNINLQNAENEDWWYTWLSCRDRFNTKLWGQLTELYRVNTLLTTSNKNISYTTSDPSIVAMIRSIASANNFAIMVSPWCLIKWKFKKCTQSISCYVTAAKYLVWGFKWWYSSAGYKKNRKNFTADTMLISIPDMASIKGTGKYRDAYFGSLTDIIVAQEKKVRVGLILSGDPNEVLEGLSKRRDDIVVESISLYLRFFDILFATRSLFNSIRIGFLPKVLGIDIKKLVTDDIKHSLGYMILGRLSQKALFRYISASPGASILHVFENNPWEKAVFYAAKRRPDPRATSGYLHCAVLESHFKNCITKAELKVHPGPDKIICTGPSARSVFLKLGERDPENVLSGCALRGQSIASLSLRKKPPKNIKRAIVVLEALPSMVRLLKFVMQASIMCPDVMFEIREHPALPLSALTLEAGIEIDNYNNLEISPNKNLEEVLESYDIAIYQGTTAAMTVVAMGIPIIKVKLEEMVNDDPLIESLSLKKIVDDPDEIKLSFMHFETMSDEIFLNESRAARDYVENYLSPPSSETLKPFIGNI
jgi:hypothetical protein